MPVTPDERSRAPLHTRLARPALALGAGALVALSLPPWGFWPLAILGIALFEVAMGHETSRRRRATIGWCFGAGWMYLGMGWMVQLTAPGFVVASAVFAGYHAIAATVAPAGPWRIVGRPAAHALAETVRFVFPFGGVPLASLGISQVGGPLVGVVRVGGVIMLTWVVLQIGVALAELGRTALARSQTDSDKALESDTASRHSQRLTMGALGAAACVVALSVVAPSGGATGETLRVAAVQGGGEQGTRATDVPSIEVTERHIEATATIEPSPELDMVLWPENAIDVADYSTSEVARLVEAESERLGVPISVGLTEDVEVDGKRRYTNAQIIVNPDGTVSSRYDKVRRVPFGEYVPFRAVLEVITSAVDQVGDAVAGETPAYLDLPTGERMGTVISWEVFFGGRAREGVALGAEFIINPTNGASYTGTIVQTQQVASSRLRAIETGRWVVQAAPTGFTAIIDADGNVLQRSAQVEQVVLTDDIQLRSGTTWYVSLGDRPVIVALFLIVAVALWRSRRRTDLDPADQSPADER